MLDLRIIVVADENVWEELTVRTNTILLELTRAKHGVLAILS
jgi:hypothetical protein